MMFMMQSKNCSHRKKSAFSPYVTLHDETKVAVRLRLTPDCTRSYGIIDTKQQLQQNWHCCYHTNSIVSATFVL